MKSYRLLIPAILLATLPLFAQVDIEIGDGITVETGSGVTVEISGDLTETGTGYFSGTISSGTRTGLTSFAGLTLSSGMDGSMTRVTGSAYSGGHGEGANLKRYYRLGNTGGSPVSADISAACVLSGDHSEANDLSGPLFVYGYGSEWSAYGSGAQSSPVTASSIEIPTGSSDWVFSEGVRVAVKIFLEGPYLAADDTMTTTLGPDDYNVIPETAPYSEDARTATVPARVTDWMLVELRSTEDGAAVGYRSCFLKSNGMLCADDPSVEYIGVPTLPGDYWIVLRHRNHLATETKTLQTGFTWGTTPATYDFTTALTQFKGDYAVLLETGVYGLITGDANHNEQVQNSDKNDVWKVQVGLAGYRSADFSLNGEVQNSDKNDLWKFNVGKGSQVVDP